MLLLNPPETKGAQLLSRRVEEIDYRHVKDPAGKGVVRFHPFGPGVEMWALPSGEVLLRHRDGKPLWEDFR